MTILILVCNLKISMTTMNIKRNNIISTEEIRSTYDTIKNVAQRTYYTLRNFTICSFTTTLCLNFGDVIFVFGWGHLHSEYLTIFYLASQSICVKWNYLLFLIMLFGLFIFTKDVASYLRFGRFSSPVLILNNNYHTQKQEDY